MPLLSQIAAAKKMEYFLRGVPLSAAILEIGSGSGWAGRSLKERGFANYKGIDLFPPADVVGDIRQWKELGLSPQSFDVILAFELVRARGVL